MNVTYFVSNSFDYGAKAIYPGIGPAFGRTLDWEVKSMARLGEASCDVAVIDTRIESGDIAHLQRFLDRPAGRRSPLFFRLTDPDMGASKEPTIRFRLEQANKPGVHYAFTYDPAGPLLEFAQTLGASKLAPLPFPYIMHREVERPIEERYRRVFVSGQGGTWLYPLRTRIRRRRQWNPLLRLAVHNLDHPGYPENGPPKHGILGEAFIREAAGFTHFFECGSRYQIELMKYVECAYAGSVPFGEAPPSIAAEVKPWLLPWSGKAGEIWRATRADMGEMRERAIGYRGTMRRLRDPMQVRAGFEQVALDTI